MSSGPVSSVDHKQQMETIAQVAAVIRSCLTTIIDITYFTDRSEVASLIRKCTASLEIVVEALPQYPIYTCGISFSSFRDGWLRESLFAQDALAEIARIHAKSTPSALAALYSNVDQRLARRLTIARQHLTQAFGALFRASLVLGDLFSTAILRSETAAALIPAAWEALLEATPQCRGAIYASTVASAEWAAKTERALRDAAAVESSILSAGAAAAWAAVKVADDARNARAAEADAALQSARVDIATRRAAALASVHATAATARGSADVGFIKYIATLGGQAVPASISDLSSRPTAPPAGGDAAPRAPAWVMSSEPPPVAAPLLSAARARAPELASAALSTYSRDVVTIAERHAAAVASVASPLELELQAAHETWAAAVHAADEDLRVTRERAVREYLAVQSASRRDREVQESSNRLDERDAQAVLAQARDKGVADALAAIAAAYPAVPPAILSAASAATELTAALQSARNTVREELLAALHKCLTTIPQLVDCVSQWAQQHARETVADQATDRSSAAASAAAVQRLMAAGGAMSPAEAAAIVMDSTARTPRRPLADGLGPLTTGSARDPVVLRAHLGLDDTWGATANDVADGLGSLATAGHLLASADAIFGPPARATARPHGSVWDPSDAFISFAPPPEPEVIADSGGVPEAEAAPTS